MTYRGLEKSCGRSLGPSGPLFLPPRSAELLLLLLLLLLTGGGRIADMALEALVLRSRLPVSVVLWNLRTRSSVGISIAFTRISLLSLHTPDEPLESSPDTFDPDLTGRSIVSMVRVPVRADPDMVNTPEAPDMRQHYDQNGLC